MTKKIFVSAQKLLNDSFKLANIVYQNNCRPNYVIGIWRGGCPIGIVVQEFFEYMGIKSDHISIKTSLYDDISKRRKTVNVYGLEYIVSRVRHDDLLLFVDDVFDTGFTIEKIIKTLRNYYGSDIPNIKVATLYFKPKNNRTSIVPDYYLYITNSWLVFPHELVGLTLDEIVKNKSLSKSTKDLLRRSRKF